MRAASLHTHGEAPEVVEREAPAAGAGQVPVTVTAVAINPLDLLCASGVSYFGPPALPYVPGVHGVGTLDDGRRVWFTTPAGMAPGDGAMAQACVVDPDRVLELPDAVPDTVAAALGWSAIAAAGALRRGSLSPGERVVVLGGAGIVGQVATQLARIGGAGRVVAVVRDGVSAEVADEAGADDVVEVDVVPPDELSARIADAAGGPVDLVVDPVWGAPAAAAVGALGPGGRLVNLGDSAGPTSPLVSAVVRSRMIDVRGWTNVSMDWAGQRDLLAGILDHAAAGRVRVRHEVRPLTDVADAWRAQAERRSRTRVVLVP
jgi:NADPH:quinone reductase-like Zn-dependent oxidoreductase